MVEPIGRTGGIIDPLDEYLPQLREKCDRHNVLLIFDEIITGIGCTGNMSAATTFGVTPDLVCLGTGIGGGSAPLSALICRRHIAAAFWRDATKNPGFVEGHTFEGNPISWRGRLGDDRRELAARLVCKCVGDGREVAGGLRRHEAPQCNRRHSRNGPVLGNRVRSQYRYQGAIRSTDRDRRRLESTREWAADTIRSALDCLGAAVNDRRAVRYRNHEVAGFTELVECRLNLRNGPALPVARPRVCFRGNLV